jgi:sialidase-1
MTKAAPGPNPQAGGPCPCASGSGLQEPGVVELADGSIFSWCRTDQWRAIRLPLHRCGQDLHAARAHRTQIPQRPRQHQAPARQQRPPRHLQRPLRQFPFPPKKRNPFVAAISTDGGKTWPQRKLIESDPDGLYHYTAIHFIGDAMLIGYCAGDSKVGALNRLRIRRITLKQP